MERRPEAGRIMQSSNSHPVSPDIRNMPHIVRIVLSTLLVLASAMALYQLSLRLIAQAHYHRAENFFMDGYYGLAAAQLEKARSYKPDDFDIQQALGEVFSKLAEVSQPSKPALHLAEDAKNHYLKASRLNPLDAHVFYGLARTEARLQQLERLLNPGSNSAQYTPLPYFEESLRLRPNSILYRYAMARYLYREGRTEDLPGVIQILARVYPFSYYDLKKEPFWSPVLRDACEKGLMEAVRNNTSVREANGALSFLKEEEENWSDAISRLKIALQTGTFQFRSERHIDLGRLYLKNDQVREAQDTFLHALDRSPTKEKHFEWIYWTYGKEARTEEFHEFSRAAKKQFIFSTGMLLILARSMIDSGRLNQARRILIELNKQNPDAEVFYLLARIAEKEKDWDQMELSIQKATVLDPDNSHYHQLFTQVLSRMNKLERAEKEAGLALKHSEKPYPWHFEQRAWIRWKQRNYLGAARDWKRATHLNPDKASFHARAADAYMNLGRLPSALKHYKMALALEPENAGYRRKYEELKNIR